MRKFFESGGAFMAVALLCFAAGLIAENGGVFIGVGAFWLVMAVIVRGRSTKKQPPEDKS
jgi:hypothetical protein